MREPIPTWCFAVVVVQRGDEFLIIQEAKRGQNWYLPAGRVERGETFAAAACRETLEEGGIPIRFVGILRVEHSPEPAGTRLRVVFLAEPADNSPPKSTPDEESLRAEWVRLDDLDRYPLRGEEVRELISYVSKRGPVAPLSLLQAEGMPFRVETT